MLDRLIYKDLLEIVFPESTKLYLDNFNNFINKFRLLLIREGIMEEW